LAKIKIPEIFVGPLSKGLTVYSGDPTGESNTHKKLLKSATGDVYKHVSNSCSYPQAIDKVFLNLSCGKKDPNYFEARELSSLLSNPIQVDTKKPSLIGDPEVAAAIFTLAYNQL
jgi:hypothetical protein